MCDVSMAFTGDCGLKGLGLNAPTVNDIDAIDNITQGEIIYDTSDKIESLYKAYG